MFFVESFIWDVWLDSGHASNDQIAIGGKGGGGGGGGKAIDNKARDNKALIRPWQTRCQVLVVDSFGVVPISDVSLDFEQASESDYNLVLLWWFWI